MKLEKKKRTSGSYISGSFIWLATLTNLTYLTVGIRGVLTSRNLSKKLWTGTGPQNLPFISLAAWTWAESQNSVVDVCGSLELSRSWKGVCFKLDVGAVAHLEGVLGSFCDTIRIDWESDEKLEIEEI